MGRINAYLVIARARVGETIAIAKIVRFRVRRSFAEAELKRARRSKQARKAVNARERQMRRLLARVRVGVGIGKRK